MVVQKSSIQACYYATTLNWMSLYMYVYIYIYIYNLPIIDTYFNHQNIQDIFLFPNLSPPSILTLPQPFSILTYFHIYICSLFISLKTNKLSICDGKDFFITTYLFLISTIKGTSPSLSHFDFSIILIFDLF